MKMRWLACDSVTVHILGFCPECHETKGGLVFGTLATNYQGRVHTLCIECGNTIDFYADAKKEKLWKLETVETKISPKSSLNIEVENTEEVDKQVKTGEPVLV